MQFASELHGSPTGTPVLLQTPPMQEVPEPHTTPQPPQLELSVVVSTQLPPQRVIDPQSIWQLPPMHTWPEPQVTPQPPQLLPSVMVFTQLAPQSVCPLGQPMRQAPITQD